VSQLAEVANTGLLTLKCGRGEGKQKYLCTEKHACEINEGKAAPGKGQ